MPTPIEILKAFNEIQSKSKEALGSSQDSEKEAPDFKNIVLDLVKEYSEDIQRRITEEYFGFGPIQNLMKDPEITEIVINGPQKIFYEKASVFHAHSDQFLSESSYEGFIHLICQLGQITYNYNVPCADGKYDQFRIHLISPPLVQNFPHITLRKHRKGVWRLDEWQDSGWASTTAIEFIKNSITSESNILFVGPTGVGKTSALSACLQGIGSNERAILIEDTDEITIPNEISLKLLTRNDLNGQLRDYCQSDLIRQALRMRPQRLIMGEVRGPEAKDLLLALSTGHRGSMCTLHAETPHQALWRLEMLVQLGAPQWNINVVRNLIALSLDIIITLGILEGKRKLIGIHRIASAESTGLTLEKLF